MRSKALIGLLAAMVLVGGAPSTAMGAAAVRVTNDGQGHGLVTDGTRLFDGDAALPGDGLSGTVDIENQGTEALRVTLTMSGLGSDGRLDDLSLVVGRGGQVLYEGPAGSCGDAGTVEVGALAPGDRCSIDVSASLDPALGNDKAIAEGGVELAIGAEPVPVGDGGTSGSVPRTGDFPVLWPALASLAACASALLLHAQRRRS